MPAPLPTEREIIQSVDVIEKFGRSWVRCTTEQGHVGVVAGNSRLPQLRSLLDALVIPRAVGFDVRDVASFPDRVWSHRSTYKFVGMPFWNAVAHVELAMWDLLGRVMNQPVCALVAKPLRRSFPVYLTRFDRHLPAAQAVDELVDPLEATGARAVKLKVGRRLRTDNEQDRRDVQVVELARRRFGDELTIYVDANGSYTPEQAIAQGRVFQTNRVAWLEEPCYFEDVAGTAEVAAALDLPVAGGEQDSSLWQFDRLLAAGALDVVNIDVFYLGGLTRSVAVAEKARALGLPVAPHTPRTGDDALPTMQFAAITPNLGPFLEYRQAPEVTEGAVVLPDAPGLGYARPDHEWMG